MSVYVINYDEMRNTNDVFFVLLITVQIYFKSLSSKDCIFLIYMLFFYVCNFEFF